MFERFTDPARRVVVLAQEESRELGHNYIGTEHLLLGLIRTGNGVAAEVLAQLDVGLEATRQQIRDLMGEGEPERAQSGHIPFTQRAKKVLELSLREALQLSRDYIGTEHILLGLIREGEGVAVAVLERLGTSPAQVREQVLRSVEAGAVDPGDPSVVRPGRPARVGGIPLPQLSLVLRRLDEIATRLAAIERQLGIGPQPEPGQPEPGQPEAGQPEPRQQEPEPPEAAGSA